MKIGIVGSGFVGATAAYALVMRGVGGEVVLVDKNTARAEAEANDIQHAVPFAHPLRVRAGDYPDLNGAQVVIITAGVNQKPDETRLQLLSHNAAVFRSVIPSILANAPNAILLVATNPVDVMTHLTATIAAEQGVPPHRVIGSGTMLDSARFRVLLGEHLGVDSQYIHGHVLGEHGDSEVLIWSTVNIGGLSLAKFAARRMLAIDPAIRDRIDAGVRQSAHAIISGKGATYYGIGSVLARIVDVILHDQRALLTVCMRSETVAGVSDVTVSLPRLVGGEGILDTIVPELNEAESDALQHSAEVVKGAIQSMLDS